MGEIKNGILSELKGSVGHITGRIVKGRNILSRKPGFRKATNDENTLKRRDKFKLTVKFGSAANLFNELKTVWQYSTPESMNYFSFFVQSNYMLTGEGVLTNRNMLTPYGGFPISTASSEVTPNSISIELNALTGAYNFDAAFEKNVKLCALVYFTDVLNPQAKGFDFLKVDFPVQAFQTANPMQFTKALLLNEKALFESYGSHKVFAALVTLDENNLPVNFSSTLCIE